MNFKQQLELKADLVNEWLHKSLPPAREEQKLLYDAMHYSLFAGGKRLRPILAMAVCEMLGGDVNHVLPFGCGIELVHTASLIHDDLPCMDDDDLRRSLPTCHKKWGEAAALLAGDALPMLAFEIMSASEASSTIVRECMHTIAVASGAGGMLGGQIMDIDGSECDSERHHKMNTLKTASLFMASAWVGAIVGAAPAQDYEAIGNYAKKFGIAFQVVDDLLDVIGTSEQIGKDTGSDKKTGKYTYVDSLGIDGAREYAENLIEEAKFDVTHFGAKSFFLQNLANYILTRSN